MITRRTFLYGLTLGTLATSLSAEAQQAGKVYRIGHVSPVDFDRPERMEQRSWPAFERRPTHDLTSLQQAAAEFVRIKVDVIVLVGGARAAVVQKVTRSIPIVTLTSGDWSRPAVSRAWLGPLETSPACKATLPR